MESNIIVIIHKHSRLCYTYQWWIQTFWKRGGAEDNSSAPSSFIANAHNEIYAFYTEKAVFWKIWANRGRPSPSLNPPLLLTPRYECGGATPNMPDAAIHDPEGQASTFFGHIARADSRMDHTRALRSIISGLPRDWKRPPGRPRQNLASYDSTGLAAAQHRLGISLATGSGSWTLEADSGNGYAPGWGMLLMMMIHKHSCLQSGVQQGRVQL